MARIEVSRFVDAPHSQVWAELADLGSHDQWMKDAESIVFTTEETSGVGTVMNVETRVGPFRTNDVIEVTSWDEGNSIEVAHTGLVKGSGVLAVSPDSDATATVSWVEELEFPWWLGGPITAWLARPVLAAIWRGNLRRLEAKIIAP